MEHNGVGSRDMAVVKNKERKKQRTQAVASLETRMRVVASLEVSNSRECGGSICAGAMAPGTQKGRVDRANLFPLLPPGLTSSHPS